MAARAPPQPPSLLAGHHLDAAAGSKAYSHAAAPLVHGLQTDSEAAAARVMDAARALLQVVWITSVPRWVVGLGA